MSTEKNTKARQLAEWRNDADLIDAALAALLGQHRTAEIDRTYAEAYARTPIDEPDEWGDLASFRDAAATT